MKQLLVFCVILFTLGQNAFCADQPLMRSALKDLQKAAEVPPPESKVVINREAFLKSAKDNLAKAPSIYKGRKTDAEKFVNAASKHLKAGHEADALTAIQKAIAKIQEGIDIVAKESSKPDELASDPNPGDPANPFGAK